MYPGTTTFYRGTVVNPPSRKPSGEWGEYTVEFEVRPLNPKP